MCLCWKWEGSFGQTGTFFLEVLVTSTSGRFLITPCRRGLLTSTNNLPWAEPSLWLTCQHPPGSTAAGLIPALQLSIHSRAVRASSPCWVIYPGSPVAHTPKNGISCWVFLQHMSIPAILWLSRWAQSSHRGRGLPCWWFLCLPNGKPAACCLPNFAAKSLVFLIKKKALSTPNLKSLMFFMRLFYQHMFHRCLYLLLLMAHAG